jgi:hypothetical protein
MAAWSGGNFSKSDAFNGHVWFRTGASTPALGMVAAAFVLSACRLAGRWQVP